MAQLKRIQAETPPTVDYSQYDNNQNLTATAKNRITNNLNFASFDSEPYFVIGNEIDAALDDLTSIFGGY